MWIQQRATDKVKSGRIIERRMGMCGVAVGARCILKGKWIIQATQTTWTWSRVRKHKKKNGLLLLLPRNGTVCYGWADPPPPTG